MYSTPIYGLRLSEVGSALEASLDGLTTREADARRTLYGENTLVGPPARPAWRVLAAQAAHPTSLLLLLAGAATAGAGDFTLAIAIWMVILVNEAFAFWRGYSANQAITALERVLPIYARVIRDGMEARIAARQLVPGDVLLLAEGDNIPADGRVIEEYGLRVNNSTLTGEAVPARKTADASLLEGISEVERPNLVFAGTSVVSGTGKAIVYATGMTTQFGRLTRLTQIAEAEPSHLQAELQNITRIMSLAGVGIGTIAFLVGINDLGLKIPEAFMLSIGIIVAAIPEGLPASLTLSLAIAVQRLTQRGVLVKKLSTLETLGTVSVICTDKSGTLTQNQMTVRYVWTGGSEFRLDGVGYEPKGQYSPNPANSAQEKDLLALAHAALLCNNSRLVAPDAGHPVWTCLGDQTEAALSVAALKAGLNEVAVRDSFPRLHELPFDARRKRMSTVHRISPAAGNHSALGAGQTVAFIKGAPAEILNLCTHIQVEGQVHPLNNELRRLALAANDRYAHHALRVLALARKELPVRGGSFSVERVESGLTFLGLAAMMDPPRPEVAEAIQTCRQAGIRMVMITGDYGLTAASLARRVGLLNSSNPLIITGADLEKMDDLALESLLVKEIIFARMAPEHKLRLVAALQARGEVVAVTGDGVNDAPALRKADIGVAMGIAGTDVAREAADIILTNDNFAMIAAAIQEGRGVYENIRKFITYILASNVPEILPFILTSLFNIPLALRVRQILAIDLGTDLLPALALGMEKPEPDLMHRPPRRKTQPLIDRSLLGRALLWLGPIEALLCYLGFFFFSRWIDLPFWSQVPGVVQLKNGMQSANQYSFAVTIFYAGVVMAQIGNAFACRTERNRGRWLGWLSNPQLLIGIAAELAILFSQVYVPGVARWFGHVPLPAVAWMGLGLFPIILYSLDWLWKALRRRLTPAGGAFQEERQ